MKRHAFCLIGIFALILLDQWSKWAVWEYLKFGGVAPMDFGTWLVTFPLPPQLFDPIPVTSFFNLVTVWNQGVSFGMFAADDMHRAFALIGLSAVLTLALAVWLVRTDVKLVTVALCMVIGGAIGIIIDRVRFGAVADFLDFHWKGHHYPAFNVADSLIVMGVAILLIDALFLSGKKSSPEPEKALKRIGPEKAPADHKPEGASANAPQAAD
jgi:signal peptidase II